MIEFIWKAVIPIFIGYFVALVPWMNAWQVIIYLTVVLCYGATFIRVSNYYDGEGE